MNERPTPAARLPAVGSAVYAPVARESHVPTHADRSRGGSRAARQSGRPKPARDAFPAAPPAATASVPSRSDQRTDRATESTRRAPQSVAGSAFRDRARTFSAAEDSSSRRRGGGPRRQCPARTVEFDSSAARLDDRTPARPFASRARRRPAAASPHATPHTHRKIKLGKNRTLDHP